MKLFNCPSCGAEVTFRSSASVYAVCSYCDSMLVRTDLDVSRVGQMAALPDDISPLQIGTEGVYNGEHFGIIGRMKIGWRDGQWNEWHIITDSGETGWIGEAQGSFSFSFAAKDPLNEADQTFIARKLAAFDAAADHEGPWGNTLPLEAGFEIILGDRRLRAVDVKVATCLGSEGELPFRAPKGRKTVAIDFVDPTGGFATVEVEGDIFRVYVGQYVEWDDAKFVHLRPLEGWS